jgi:CRISPR-associated protein Cst2
MNLAKALEPYRFNAVFTQSPQFSKDNPWKVGSSEKGANSSLLHRETAHTAFQYPFALNGEDCRRKPDWVKALLRAVGELANVAGNHARSYYEMSPASIVVRLTSQLVAGYKTYGFHLDGSFPEVVTGILQDPTPDYQGREFYFGGSIIKDMSAADAEKLTKRGVTLDRNPQRLLETVAAKFLGGE